MSETKQCKKCGVFKPLDQFYKRKSGSLFSRCAECERARVYEYESENRERAKQRAMRYRTEHKAHVSEYNKAYWAKYHTPNPRKPKQFARPSSPTKNRSCATFLGVHVAERALLGFFDNIKRMPANNPGFDFVCGRGFKIDAKSSCLRRLSKTKMGWSFNPQKNAVADYFILLAFDNRENLEPMHVWLVPGNILNQRCTVYIQNTPESLSKWSIYERPLDRVVACCSEISQVSHKPLTSFS